MDNCSSLGSNDEQGTRNLYMNEYRDGKYRAGDMQSIETW